MIFLDSNVVIAAVLSSRGGSFRLFREAGSGNLRLAINRYVHDEVTRALLKKYPHALPRLADMLNASNCERQSDQPPEAVRRYVKLLPAGDAPVLAGAIAAHAQFLITLDRDFMNPKIQRTHLPLTTATPREFFQQHWR